MKKVIIIIIVLLVIALGYYFISKKPAATTPVVNTTSAVQPVNNTMPNTNTSSSASPSAPLPTSDSGSVAKQPSAPAPAVSVVSNTSVTSSKASVTIDNYAFSPTPLTVKAGTAITWTNDDSVAHTVTSDSGTVLNSPLIKPGTSFSFTFTTPGTYTYHCSIHPDMHGTVVVTS